MSPRRPEERLRQQLLLSTSPTTAAKPALLASCPSASPVSDHRKAERVGRDYRAERERPAQNTSARMALLRQRPEQPRPARLALIAQPSLPAALPVPPADTPQV